MTQWGLFLTSEQTANRIGTYRLGHRWKQRADSNQEWQDAPIQVDDRKMMAGDNLQIFFQLLAGLPNEALTVTLSVTVPGTSTFDSFPVQGGSPEQLNGTLPEAYLVQWPETSYELQSTNDEMCKFTVNVRCVNQPGYQTVNANFVDFDPEMIIGPKEGTPPDEV